jgi:2,3-bisphosphoglycerate-dependent phosphoglycerate mutase
MGTLVLVRHGESEWNSKGLFTGWVDVGLAAKGVQEASAAGRMLVDAGLRPDVVHTSVLTRAISTANGLLEEAGLSWLPVRRSWRLNERHYGALQGKDKAQTREEFGDEQFMTWRRSYDVPPPPIADDDPLSQAGDPRYATLPPELRPRTECLKDVLERMLPYWYDAIVPELAPGAGEAPGRDQRRGDRRAQHPDRHPAALRAGRRVQAHRGRRALPGPGGGRDGGRGR